MSRARGGTIPLDYRSENARLRNGGAAHADQASKPRGAGARPLVGSMVRTLRLRRVSCIRSVAEAMASSMDSLRTSTPPQLNWIESEPMERSWKSHSCSAIRLSRR